ncbi:phosphoribosylformylglycinamidine synthase synthetase subunit [Jejuia pallidilutea]|uniref:Phosphoribosylformylglycinamidine synthase synthetase subunit n=1 Tax=Jejuia pallidilutea TaxID=504487 RepID=A0A090VRL6_9FLAO|nr:phosphoribosylformylglycinamidine synthase synthetase subunit [Jejuia pallidilutea]
MVESEENHIVSIHDHGAGGHLNCLSELVEETGGKIDLDALPVGDPTLSDKEIIGNESQERMGLVIGKKHIETLHKIADRDARQCTRLVMLQAIIALLLNLKPTDINQWIWPWRICLVVLQKLS